MKLTPKAVVYIDPESGQKIENYLPEDLMRGKVYRVVKTVHNGWGELVMTDRLPNRWINMSWFRETDGTR